MSHLNTGLISAYNSLTDRHLAGYFSNTRIRRHLQRAGLITRSGRIVPDKEYRHTLIQRAHQRHIRECLAQAIFHKVLEMERVHQIEIKRKLEEFARRERVHKIKVERPKRYEEDAIRILSPRPPTGAKCTPKQHSGPEGEHSESSESPGSSRPNTAPGKMQRPVRLKPIRSNSTAASLRRGSPGRLLRSSNENDRPPNRTMDKASRRRLTTAEVSHGVSPYCLPVINNFVTPVPPATKRKERGAKVTASGALRGRRLRPTTASSGPDLTEVSVSQKKNNKKFEKILDPPVLRSSVHQSKVRVDMIYFGKTVHLSHDLSDMRDEIKVFQQHCGGENLCVFRGRLSEGETFQFISRRHRGFPFSLTFFLSGLQVERLSSCCEFKHRKGPRLGGRHGHFGFRSVEGASPCYKCIIAMGLDKKPTPPPRRVKEDNKGGEESASSLGDAPRTETETAGGDEAAAHPEREARRSRAAETRAGEGTDAGEDKVRDDYEEDFEADDEGPPGVVEAKENKPSSPAGETGTQADEGDASETEDEERDEDMKSNSGSSSSESDREESDAEATKDRGEDERADGPREVHREDIVVPPGEMEDGPDGDEDSDARGSGRDSSGEEVHDTSDPAGSRDERGDYDTSGGRRGEETVDEEKREERERAKSVQEKLAEAILKESQCSSEPELSDTSTEEDESTHKGPEKDSKVNSVTLTEHQPALEEEMTCEEGVVGENKLLKDPDKTSEPKEHENETEQEPRENSDSTRDEKVEREKDKTPAENAEPEPTEYTALHPISEEAISEDPEASEPQEDAAAQSTEGEAAENNKENAAETGRGTKSGEEDESSVSEPDIKADGTDDAEAGAMATSETMEMKAEPSEEREALNYEEAPVIGAEESRRGDGEDGDAASETGVTAENSSSSCEWSGDAAVHRAADASGDVAKDESTKDDVKEEEASAAEDGKDVNKQRGGDLGEEQTEKTSVGIDEEMEEKRDEEEKQTNPVEKTGGESEKKGEDETEEEENDECKTEERIENQENISEWDKSDSNAEGNADEEQAEGDHSGDEAKVANEGMEEESEKSERDEGERRNKKDEEHSEEKGVATDETNDWEKMNADGEKDGEAEEEENKDEGESEEKKVATDEPAEGEEISEIPQESEKNADLDQDNVKTSDVNIAESAESPDREAAQGTETAEEVPNNAKEAEDVMKETEGGGDNREKEELDAENDEMSAGAEKSAREGPAQTEAEDDVNTTANTADGRTAEEPTAAPVASGDALQEREGDQVYVDVGQSEAVEEKGGVEKQDESTGNVSEPQASGSKVTEESKSEDQKDGDAKPEDNGNISDPGNQIGESDLMKTSDNQQRNVGEVVVASSADQVQSSPDTAADPDGSPYGLDESAAPSGARTDEQPPPDGGDAATTAADLSAADEDNGADTEEASKASEEGASVLLKPHKAQSNGEKEESEAAGSNAPQALARGDNADLVTNWVTVHQTAKYFETFVEPLEDLKESSPLEMERAPESAQREHAPQDETRDKSEGDTVVSNIESDHGEDGEPREGDRRRVDEKTETKDSTPKTESEGNDAKSASREDVRSEEHEGSGGSVEEEKVQGGVMQDTSERPGASQTEVESIAGSHRSVTSGGRESVRTKETTDDSGPEKATTVGEAKDLFPSSETGEHRERPAGPEGPSMPRETEPNDSEGTWGKSGEQSQEVTEITDFTSPKSDDGSQEGSRPEDGRCPSPDAATDGGKRDAQLIEDIRRTLSKDLLSTFSVDETTLGQSSRPLLTESRH
ncbi:glutamate-rich protein 3 isoform X2 [Gasterosteus aculeatus]